MADLIKKVGVFGKYGAESLGEELARLCAYLQHRGLQVLVEASSPAPALPNVERRALEGIGQEIDLAIVIGGDGTLLHVARGLAGYPVPLIGVNLGRLGFLTDIPADAMLEEIGRILDGDFQAEERILLRAEVGRRGAEVCHALALNDVIVSKGEVVRLIEYETYIDGEFVNRMRADGLIIATPTGSTAYAMSAGGPILHPMLPAVVLVPICPHTLSDRPLVVGSGSTVEVVIPPGSHQRAQVSFDGQSNFALEDGDRVRVYRSQTSVRLLHPVGRSHYDVLRAKLHWGG